MDKLNNVYQTNSNKAPKIVFVMEGTFQGKASRHAAATSVTIKYEMKMIGAGQKRTFLTGYNLCIEGTKEEGKEVVVQDMTSSCARYGVYSKNGLSFLCDSMTFTECVEYGVYAYNTEGRLNNCVITHCGNSGIFCTGNTLIELEGSQTKVDGNVTRGWGGGHYGLFTDDKSSIIHLLFPLTKESVSTNNYGRRNYGGRGTIEEVTVFGRE